jgi:hypothetical protein
MRLTAMIEIDRKAAMIVCSSFATRLIKTVLFLFACVVLGLTILRRPDWKLRDFDQVFYVTIAYDLNKYEPRILPARHRSAQWC